MAAQPAEKKEEGIRVVPPLLMDEGSIGEVQEILNRLRRVGWWSACVVSAVLILCLLMVWGLVRMLSLEKSVQSLHMEVQKLEEVVKSQTEEEVIFLKIVVLRPRVRLAVASEVARHVAFYARLHKQDPDLVLAVMDIESQFRPQAESVVGAKGLMQLMSHWRTVFNIPGDLFDIETNIRLGVQVLSFYRTMYKDLEWALAAYNRGPSRVDWSLIKDKDPDVTGYVEKVLAKYNRLKNLDIGGGHAKD